MTLKEASQELSTYFEFSEREFLYYCSEDNIGGYDERGNWPSRNCIRENEGKILYALIRSLKPLMVVEFGTCFGCSTSHLTAALEANRKGKIITVDIDQSKQTLYSPRLTNVEMDGIAYSQQIDFPVNLIFHDGHHSEDFTRDVLINCLPHLIPNGTIIVHDVFLPSCGKGITLGMRQALGNNIKRILVEPSECGLGYWKKPSQ